MLKQTQQIMHLKLKIKILIMDIIYSPNIYVALVIGALVGGLFGALIGLFTGLYMSIIYDLCIEYPSSFLGYSLHWIDLNALFCAVGGSIIGAFALGNASWMATSLHTYKNYRLPKKLSKKSIQPVIKFCLLISIELSLGTVVGAVIGSLIYPLIGTILGGIIGFFIMLLITILQTKYSLQKE